jgi:ABC-2 type transport system permease protein
VTYILADLRAFGAAARRELRSIRRYPMLVFGSLFWPILLPANYVLLGRVYAGGDERAVEAFAQRAGTPEVAGFVFVGFAMYMWLSLFLWGPGTQLRQEQIRGTLEAVMLTPVSRLVVLFGPPVAHVWPVLFQFAVMAIALNVIFGVPTPADALLRALIVILVGVPSMYTLASLFSAFVLRYGEIGPVVHFVRGSLVLLAGITYPIVMLPEWAQAVASVMPSTYIVDGVRQVLLAGAAVGDVAGHLAAVAAITVAFAVAAALLYRWIETSARRTGALSRY